MPFCSRNIRILALLAAAREQYHQPVAVLAEVNPVPRTKINPVLIDAGTDTFNIRKVTLHHPMDRCRHLDRRGYVQTIEPFGLRTDSLGIKVLSNLYHVIHMVSYMLPLSMPEQRSILYLGGTVVPVVAHSPLQGLSNKLSRRIAVCLDE